MFEWLEREISAIKTPRFHVVDGPADQQLREAIVRSCLQLPQSYKEFVLKFGNARLYRRPQNNSYHIGIFAGPREETLDDRTRVYHIGFHDGARVYIKPLDGSARFSILEIELHFKEEVTDDFEEWLTTCCAGVRNAYGHEKWANILRGPDPFTPEEKEIIEARRRIRWRLVGIDMAGLHVFEVTNASRRTLPVLTVGVRSRDGRLNGAILLRIGHIGPGETAELHASCYKDLKPPEDIEVFALSDPQPEDREQYGEFG